MHRPWRVLIPDMLLLECPYFFHITLRTNSPGLAPPTMTGPSRINHYLRKYFRAGSYVVIFSIEVSFFQSLGVKQTYDQPAPCAQPQLLTPRCIFFFFLCYVFVLLFKICPWICIGHLLITLDAYSTCHWKYVSFVGWHHIFEFAFCLYLVKSYCHEQSFFLIVKKIIFQIQSSIYPCL